MTLLSDKNIKFKQILWILIAVLSMSGFSAVSADTGTQTQIESHLLSELGITSIKKESSAIVTREEFACILFNMSYARNVYSSGGKFISEQTMQGGAAAMEFCDANGYINAEDGIFHAGYPVLQSEAVEAFVKLLGYADIIQEESDILRYAAESGLLEGISYNAEYPMEAREMFAMAENALSADIVVTNVSGNNKTYTICEDKNLLSEIFDVYETKGIVNATEYAALGMYERAVKDAIIIGNQEYMCPNTDTFNLTGKNVKAYYKWEQNADTGTIVYIEEKDNRTVSVTDVDIDDNSVLGSFKYYSGSKVFTAKISNTADVVVNGENIGYSENYSVNIPESSVTLISNDNDNIYDVVIINSYINYYVSRIDSENMIIYDRYGQNPLNLADADRLSVFKDGTKSGFEAIKNGSCISVIADNTVTDSDGNKYISGKPDAAVIFINSRKVSGNISGYNDNIVTVSGTEYELAQNIAVGVNKKIIPEIKPGESISASLDLNGKIMQYELGSASAERYAYLIKSAKETVYEYTMVRILDCDGSIKNLTIRDKAVIDGVSVKKYEEQYDKLFDAEGIISYRTNDEGEIIKIDTKKFNSGSENKLTSINRYYSSDGETLYYSASSGRVFGGKVILGQSPLVFVVPNDTNNISEYYVTGEEYFGSSGDFQIDAYNPEVRVSNLIVAYDKGNFQTSTAVFAISDIRYGVGPTGDIFTIFDGFENGSKKTIYIDESTITVFKGTSKTPVQNFDISSLSVGDVIRYISNNNGIVSNIQLLERADAYGASSDNYDSSYRTVWGRAYDISGNIVEVSMDGNCDDEENTEVFDLTGVPVYVYENGSLEKSSAEDILPYRPSEQISDTDSVFLFTTRSKAKILIIYR